MITKLAHKLFIYEQKKAGDIPLDEATINEAGVPLCVGCGCGCGADCAHDPIEGSCHLDEGLMCPCCNAVAELEPMKDEEYDNLIGQGVLSFVLLQQAG